MSFYSDWLHYKNNRCVEDNSHRKQELFTELERIHESQQTENLAYKIDRYLYRQGITILTFGFAVGLLVGIVLGAVMYGIP